jgi:hypothetical protein
MNEPEKSDPAIVAMKPANKAGQPAAEWVEPRAGTKGNTGQPRTRRAQNRASVSQGLERVRKAAKLEAVRRQTPEVGARCVNCARRDLCGGRSVMGVPTANSNTCARQRPVELVNARELAMAAGEQLPMLNAVS